MRHLLYFLVLSFLLPINVEAQTARSVLDQMFRSFKSIRTLEYTLKTKERYGSTFKEGKAFARINNSPKKIYVKSYYPNEGVEILYRIGENSNKCLVYPNGLPYFNVSFSPYNERMRKDNHHAVVASGFQFVGDIVQDNINKAGADFGKHFFYKGEVTWNGKKCHKIEMINDEFDYVKHTIPSDTYLWKIANKHKVSEHMLLEINGLRAYGRIKAGTVLKIPNTYAKKAVFYIDKTNNIPVVQYMYDEKGLYEKYEFVELRINPTFPSDEFTEDCSSYKF